MRTFVLGVMALGLAVTVASADEATEKIYKMKCKMCHGADGRGLDAEAAAKRKLDPTKLSLEPMLQKTTEENIKITAEGKDKMPGYAEKLTADEIKAVVEYCGTLLAAPVAPAAE